MERFTTRPELRGTFGMVASTHWLASAAGMAMLERGGNAFDAAVAAGFVLQVVEPHLNGPGGEVPILLYSAERDEVLVVDGQGTAPAAATIERFRELGHELVPGTGLLAACVPGRVRRLAAAPARVRDAAARGGAGAGDRLRRERLPARAGDLRDDRLDGAGLPRRVARARPSCTCRFRSRARSSATATWPRPTGGCSPSRAASSRPRASFYRGFVAEAIARGGLAARPATTSPRGRRRSSSRSRAATTAGTSPRPGRGARGRSSCSSSRCSKASSSATAKGPTSSTRSSSAPSSPSPTARPGTATVDVPLDDLLSAGLRGRAAQARRRRGLGRAAARQPGRPRAAAPAHPDARRPSPGPASRPAATPATSTWSTASATPSRRRPAAAGCTARR